jgi:hypothetical protein
MKVVLIGAGIICSAAERAKKAKPPDDLRPTMQITIVGLGIICLMGSWIALKGIRATREQLLELAGVIGTKNPTLARIVCWVSFIPLFFCGLGSLGWAGIIVYEASDDVPLLLGLLVLFGLCGIVTYKGMRRACDQVFMTEVARAEDVVRDALEGWVGRAPDRVSLTGQGDGKYTGTVTFGAETWDVTATVRGSEVTCEARKQVPAGM